MSDGRATAISGLGEVVGRAVGLHNSLSHAFVYSGGELVDLSPLLGTGNSSATEVNDAGQIVGDLDVTAFLLNPGGGAGVDLNTFRPAGYLYSFNHAIGINDAGQILVTGTYDPDGRSGPIVPMTHSFILTPTPEPAEMGMLGTGLILVVRPWGRRGAGVLFRDANRRASDGCWHDG